MTEIEGNRQKKRYFPWTFLCFLIATTSLVMNILLAFLYINWTQGTRKKQPTGRSSQIASLR